MSYVQELQQGTIPVIWTHRGGLLHIILARGGAWTCPKPVEVVPERMAGWRWSDRLPDEDKGVQHGFGWPWWLPKV